MSSQESNVKCKNVERGVWLVKVPKYVSEQWSRHTDSCNVGRLRIVHDPRTGRQDVVYMQDQPDNISLDAPSGSMSLEHKFIVNDDAVRNQTLAILREDAGSFETKPSMSIEGRVIKRAEIRPEGSQQYMRMKINHIEALNKPIRFIKQMDRAEVKFKPVAKHIDHIIADREKKEGKKAIRLEKHQLREMIFQAFEKHQYYNIKDVCAITKQPYTFVREVLNEICIYNAEPPRKNLWELKPEYRHYTGDT